MVVGDTEFNVGPFLVYWDGKVYDMFWLIPEEFRVGFIFLSHLKSWVSTNLIGKVIVD